MSTKKTKVLLAMGLPPPYSGYELFTKYLLQCGLEENFDLVHVNTSIHCSNVARGKFGIRSIILSVYLLLKLYRVMKREKPDILNIPMAKNTWGFLRSGSIILLGSFLNAKIVSRLGGDHFNVFYDNSSNLMKRFIRMVLKRIDLVIVRGEVLRKQFKDLVPDNKVHRVYPAIAVDDFKCPEKRHRSIRNGNGLKILSVGAISRSKGSFDILRAVRSVVEMHPDIKFNFVGDILQIERNIVHVGPNDDLCSEFEAIIRNEKIEKYVNVINVKEPVALRKYYWDADIFVMASYSEAVSLVVAEAMAAGLPVVITPVGALPEVIKEGENAFYVPVGDSKAISKNIIALINDDSLREKMGRRNMELAEAQFNLKTLKLNMTEAWSFVLKK